MPTDDKHVCVSSALSTPPVLLLEMKIQTHTKVMTASVGLSIWKRKKQTETRRANEQKGEIEEMEKSGFV